MNEFWHFAGNYWWLVFPLAGMAGGVANNLRRRAKVRHKRRLEVLAAKRDLKAVEIQARAAQRAEKRGLPIPEYVPLQTGATQTASSPEPQAIPVSRKQEVKRLMDEHDAVIQRWLEYELDVAKLIAYPQMSDGRNDLTASFLRAKLNADSHRPSSAKDKIAADDVRAYRAAVVDFKLAFDVAERDAKRAKDRSFTEDERKRLDRAQQLLKVALDQAATQAERQVAYRRVREELDGLIVLSDEAVVVLEKQVAGEIGAGSSVKQPASKPDTAVATDVAVATDTAGATDIADAKTGAADAQASDAPAEKLTPANEADESIPIARQSTSLTPPPADTSATWPAPRLSDGRQR